jgi:hypothetical protein
VKTRFRGETVLRIRTQFGEEWKQEQKENAKSKQGVDIKKKMNLKKKGRIEFRHRMKRKEKENVL